MSRAAFDLGAVQQARGRLRAAQRTYERGLEVTGADTASPSAGMIHVGLAEVHFERDELADANRQVTTGLEYCRRLAYLPPLIAGLIMLARLRHAEGDPAGALAAVEEAERAMPQPVLDPRLPLAALRAHLAMIRGDLAEAARWVRAAGLAVDDEPVYLREPEYCLLARLRIAEQDPAAALAVLERWRALALAQGRTASVLRLRVLEALAHHAASDRTAALRALAEALALAAPEGYVRVFLDEGPTIAALLQRAHGRSPPRTARRASGAARVPRPARPTPSTGTAPGSCRPRAAAPSSRRGWRRRCPPASTRCSR